MRVFIAIEFDENIKEYLQEVAKKTQTHSIKGNFTKKENYHITVRFIGEVSKDDIEKLKQGMDEAVEGQKPFMLYLDKLGYFTRQNKKILWIGVEESQELQKLHKAVENILEQKGYKKEGRELIPHITLGKEVLLQETFEKLQEFISLEPRMVAVNKLSLMQSTHVEGKLTYIPIYIKQVDSSV